jgi:hypothetical protein
VFTLFANGVIDTGGKYAAGIVDIGGKFAASQVKKNQAHLLNREPLSWFCVSDLLTLI